ncbi:helix-turn-helix domain-containing protein [Nonomuraea sp. CA-143628]|uniref:helix-turn-helix domain-containing protein n=1 Tax=Nonomuraea sp. CA-143628 TaxID=3239997 RepID=UPI003D8F6216
MCTYVNHGQQRVWAGGMPSLAARLKRLRELTINPEDGEPYSLREVAKRITAAGTPITDAYLSLLETGRRKSISVDKAVGIAGFYGVPVEYMREGPDEELLQAVESQLCLFRRVAELPPEARRRIARAIERERQEHGLPFDPGV